MTKLLYIWFWEIESIIGLRDMIVFLKIRFWVFQKGTTQEECNEVREEKLNYTELWVHVKSSIEIFLVINTLRLLLELFDILLNLKCI